MKELDVIACLDDFPEEGLIRGQVGTIVHEHVGGTHFEVEFVDRTGHTYALATLPAASLVQLHFEKVSTKGNSNVGRRD
ncbi:DUF4926 domain-containing protein [Silvimonas sp.]|uniref:DUF4926 domain-containing protein n=1 Tax=Silvimonas sp. TaxID=2650811 RepID=UPI00284EB67D|nr:DUF4926 domain-containing protein [Silvimonas sp.]MDR3427010.1 DUF4926 domain-containing protein [Silvimonas sp.]